MAINKDFIMLTTILMAIGFAFIIEGLIPALFPNRWQAYIKKLAKEPTGNIRTMGMIICIFGVIIVWSVMS